MIKLTGWSTFPQVHRRNNIFFCYNYAMKPANNSIQIELHVSDFRLVKKFYGKLGFEVVWERDPSGMKGYLVMKMADNILCFWSGNDEVYNHPYLKKYKRDTKRGYAVEIVIMIEDIESYYTKVKDFANVVEALQMWPWGLKDFRAEDPFGFYVRFTESYNILYDANAIK